MGKKKKNTPQTAVKRPASPAHSSSTNASPVKPRNLGGALAKKGRDTLSALFQGGSSSQPIERELKEESCPSTPATQNNHSIPAPSSFLAAKISPLRSSTRRSNGASTSNKGVMQMAREETPPPQVDSIDKGFEMFLSPRTPKPITHFEKGTKSSGLTPRFTPGFTMGLTPTNFASDFGKGHKKEGSMNALDANNVFAWLNTPTAEGLFSPTGLNSLSVTNTPRGMYGFIGPSPGKTLTGHGQAHAGFNPPRLAPTPSRTSGHHPAHFFAELEHGGDAGVNTPKIPDSQRSMICISPLASKKSGQKKNGSVTEGVLDTPMSINFSEVFASPRLPTPRLSRTMSAPSGPTIKGEEGTSSLDGHASPVASALHTAERDINLDDDLNALLQLAETTTPGGRPMTFMSPLLSNSLRRSVTNVGGPHQYNSELVRNGSAPPSSLQLPIISNSSISDIGSPQKKLARKGSSPGRGGHSISPPQLAIRSSLDGAIPTKSSLKKKSKKRKAPTTTGSPNDHHPQHPSYPHPNMMHYRHPHAAPAPAHNGYYHHSTYPGHHAAGSRLGHSYSMAYPPTGHPAPQQHYAYSEQQPSSAASTAVTSGSPMEDAPPVKTARKSKGSRRSSKSSKSRSKSHRADEDYKPEGGSRPAATAPSTKRARKSSSKAPPKKSSKNTVSDPVEKQRITAAIYAVNTVYGDGCEKEKKLAAATLRGVTQRPSGKWQAQLYYAGKSRYIGVFDSKEKASLAYEIAREVLKTDKGEDGPANAEETDRNVTLARKAAFAGVNEHSAN